MTYFFQLVPFYLRRVTPYLNPIEQGTILSPPFLLQENELKTHALIEEFDAVHIVF